MKMIYETPLFENEMLRAVDVITASGETSSGSTSSTSSQTRMSVDNDFALLGNLYTGNQSY